MATTPGDTRMSDADARELAALQARAYGPDAQIDEVGRRRLRDLEEQHRPGGSTHGGTPSVTLAGRAAEAEPDLATPPSPLPRAASPTTAHAEALRDDGDHPAVTTPRRRHPLLLVVGAVGLSAAMVALGAVLAQPASPQAAGVLQPVAIEQGAADRVVGTASFSVRRLDPDTLVQYEPLGQGTPWSAVTANGSRCLILTVTDDSPEMIAAAGVWDVACAPAGLDPIIDWKVDRSYPSPPQQLPEDSVVRLTLEADDVSLSIGRAG